MLRDRLAERPRIVAFAAAAICVLVLTAALVGGLIGASFAGEESANADQTAAELRTARAENRWLRKRERQLSAGAVIVLRQANVWKRRYRAERRRDRGENRPSRRRADGRRRGRERRR